MQIRLLIATLILLLAMAGKAQVFQTNNTPYKFRGVKADSILISAKGCDTAYLSNPKWGTSTAGALYVDTCNNRFYFHNGISWSQVSGGGGGADSFYYNLRSLNDTTAVYDRGDRVDTLVIRGGIGQFVDSVTTVGDSLYYWKGGTSFFSANLALAAAGGDTTIFEQITDSTGNDNFRALYAFNGKISGSFPFRFSPVFNRLILSPYASVSSDYDTVRLVVDGASYTGRMITRSGFYESLAGGRVTVGQDSIKFTPTPTATDTTTYKPAALSSTGALVRLNRWPGSGGADTTGIGDLFIRNQFAGKEAKTFNIRSGRLDSLYASGSGGVHFATNSGASAFEYGGGGGTQVTFNGFAGYNANRAASYTARSFTDKNYVDSSITAVPTVASYGKNAGGDSTILLLSNGQRFAAKDSTGSGGGITIDNVAVRRIPQGTFNHYVGFNSGVGGTGTSGGNVTTDAVQAGENLVMFKDAGFSFRTNGRFDGQNMLVGTRAGKWVTNSAYNIGIGYETLGGANTSVADSLWSTLGSGSHIAIGFQALSKIKSNDAQNSQVAIGRGAMANYTSCSGCTNSQVAIGTNALNLSSTSQKNTAVGGNALSVVTTNGDNTAVGWNSLSSNTGQSNTAVGSQALLSNTNQQGSTAVGFNAGVLSTGGFNSFFGWASGGNLSVSGSNNTSIGAGNVVGTSGSNNVSIGASIGVLSNTASDQFALGSNSVRWLISNVSGSSRRWTFNGTTSDITATEASAALEVRSTMGGLLVPRMTATQASAIGTPADGNILYVTDTNATFTSVGFWGRENGAWVKL